MNRIILLIFMLSTLTMSATWKPIFAGHRGGYTGVSNTAECYRNGVDKYGYTGLECDVRVTKDGEYVIMHDETTNSLGGNLTVANSTLAELKAETLTQTRSGVEYTGKICTVSEYLDICVEKNAFPLVELKYTTGINTSSMTNFPGLMSLIEGKGLREKVVFLTSMKSSLEYIRTNYPDVKCQFLTNANWETHFDWCVKWGINPSIQTGCFDQNTVVKFHQKGLSVAMWTVNDEANYKKYGNMGVYMMTCDYLYPKDMAELDEIDWNKFPTILEPLEIETKELWSRSAANNNLPANFPAGNGTLYKSGQQAAYSDGKFYVNDYTTKTLLVFDKDCAEPTVLDENQELGGSAAMGIASDDAGNIIQRYEESISTSPSSIRIFKKGETKSTIINFSLVKTGQTNFVYASGDIFSDEGGYVYLYPKGQTEISVLHIVNGQLAGDIEVKSGLSIAASTAGVVIPIYNNPNRFVYQVRSNGFYMYNGENKGDYLTGTASTTLPKRNSSLGGAYIELDGHEILIHPSGYNYNGGFCIRDMSASAESLASYEPLGNGGYSANSSTGTFMKVEKINDRRYNLYCYTMGNGYGAYEIAVKGSGSEVIASDNNNTDIRIAPNPTYGELNIKSNSEISSVEIYSINGTKVAERDINGASFTSVDISNYNAGIYFVVINKSTIKKIVKL
ncbi:MAG: glycerophosphodiester phosphodiesterase family protein [Muribaculaceae bacterium]|nr:glycerophosphodiester phosphodiesterase family protein [Muribaculaceae bacterium]